MRKPASTIHSVSLGLALLASATQVAADPASWATYAEDVDKTVTTLVGEVEVFRLTDGQLAIIKSLAYQEGTDVLCPGFETDEEKRIEFLSQIAPMRDEEFRTATVESLVLRSEVMFAFGTHFGATIAAGKADPAAFCAKAELGRLEPGLVAGIWQQLP